MLGVLATGNNLLQGVEWLLKKKESGFRLERIDMREKRSDCNMQMRFSRDMYSTYSMYVKSIRNSNSNSNSVLLYCLVVRRLYQISTIYGEDFLQSS